MKKGIIIGILIGALLFGSMGVIYGTTLTVESSDVTYDNSASATNGATKTNLKEAVDELYSRSLYTSLSGTQNVNAGASSTNLSGLYKMSNYKITCASCPALTSISGTQNIAAGSSSSTLNGNYSASNYKVTCASCPTLTSISGTTTISPGSSSTTLSGNYSASNYKVSCSACAASNCSGTFYKTGSFNATKDTIHTVSLGFKPSYIFVMASMSVVSSSDDYYDYVYMSSINSSKVWHNYSNGTHGWVNVPNTNETTIGRWGITEITSTGFKYRHYYDGKIYYMAIK